MYRVIVHKNVLKNIGRLPLQIQKKLKYLVMDLQNKGAILSDWANFSKIGKNECHCHLAYKWVACWRHEKNSIIIEVYYAGSRENAPY